MVAGLAARADSARCLVPSQRQQPERALALVARVGWSAASLMLALTALEAWTGTLPVPSANPVSVALIGVGVGCVIWCWASPADPTRRFQLVLLVAMSIAIVYYAASIWISQPSYGTDAVAFDQYSATLALHGHNPYTASMQPSLQMFHVPVIYKTFELNGSTVYRLSYPAGSFLLYVPMIMLGIHAQAANIVDLGFWLLAMFVLWRCLPTQVRWAAPIVMSADVYLGYVFGGVSDALFLPFVIVAVYRWDRFCHPEARRARWNWRMWVGPVALGVAMSVKQTPWFLLPFLLAAIWCEVPGATRVRLRRCLQYAAISVGVFAAINLPFAATAPGAWVRGSLLPLVEPTIPDGQGLVNLSIYERIGGGHLELYSLAGGMLLLGGLVVFVLFYERLKRAWVPLVTLSFFLPTRSLAAYLIMLLPAAIVAGSTVDDAPMTRLRLAGRHRLVVTATAAALVAGSAGYALASPAPLSIKVLGTRSTGQLLSVDEINVQVVNHTGQTVRPHFTVNYQGKVTTFWWVDQGGAEVQPAIPPHTTTTLTLHTPNVESEPPVSSPLIVEAFAGTPASVSSSPRYLVSPLSLYLTPDEVDHPVPVGRPMTLVAHLQNRFGSEVHRAGVTVLLGQVVYAQNALAPGEASINGAPEGRTPVRAITAPDGSATFVVSGVQPQAAPVYFQAWIAGPRQAPHGYSNSVLIQFER